MDIGEIIKDSVRYPFSDWKKILILGIIIVISGINSFFKLGMTNNALIVLSIVIVLITGFLVNGYTFRIIKSSLDGTDKLPEFNKWIVMLTDGFKVFIIFMTYLTIPIIVIFILIILAAGSDFYLSFEQVYTSLVDSNLLNPLMFLNSGILPVLEYLVAISFDLFPFQVLFYLILVMPIFFVAIANMAYEGELRDAFRLLEIIEIIRDIGLIKLIKWYTVTVIIFLTLFIIGNTIYYLLFFLNIPNVSIISELIILPYIYMFYGRAVALIYLPEEHN
jgi:hypothetical protein